MVVIVAGTGLIALYANVQKARRDTIEKVTITPISSTPIASASPAPQP
jgi:threonine dehydrogenase-like Zn-dependent dehydrogenase